MPEETNQPHAKVAKPRTMFFVVKGLQVVAALIALGFMARLAAKLVHFGWCLL